ncbi:MAG: hypothetical protein ACM359_00515 [Bacillota bacterium]
MKRTIPDHSRWLKVFPELAFIDDPAERAVLWRAAVRTSRWLFFASAIPLVVLVVFLVNVVFTRDPFPLLRELLGIPDRPLYYLRLIVPVIVNGTMGIWGPLCLFWLFRRRIQRTLRQQLLARGVPICLGCGYDLRGQLEPRCPECGTPFDPSLLPPCSR